LKVRIASTGGVYLYFGGVLSDGGTMLTRGSYEDLEKLEVQPKEGLRFTFYDFDADDENRPTYLCAEGVLHFDVENKRWCALVDENTFRTVPRLG
jgi:hypothetical protein